MKLIIKNVCVTVFCLFIIFPLLNKIFANDISSGNIIFLSGNVYVDEQPGKKGMPVLNGAIIRTEESSICEIVFNEKNIIKIFPSSHVTLNLNTPERSIGMISGALAVTVKKLGKLLVKEKFQLLLKTPTVVAGVRGTSFYVNCETPEQTYFCVCNGEIYLENPDGSYRRTIEAAHHKAFWFALKDEKVQVAEAPMLYHMDADIEKLSDKIGVSIDWSIADQKKE